MTTRTSRTSRAFAPLGSGAFVALVLLSCNAVLDNSEARLVTKEAPDAGAPAANCPFGQKECGGACVDVLSPAFGCQGKDCSACELKNTLDYKCAGAKEGLECGVQSCFDRYFNCDGKNPTGCESDLRKVDNCGSCGAICADPDYCDSYSAQVHCVQVCPPGATKCEIERQCVDIKADIANCGTCGHACPAPPGTIPTCTSGQCAVKCDTARGFHECGGMCLADSVDSCGPSCTKCPAADANHTMSCESGKCTEKCRFPTCNGACIPPAECTSSCGNNPVDCGSGKCDTDICVTSQCGGCSKPCTPPPNMVASCAPPDGVNANCHCLYQCTAGTFSCPGGCVPLTADPNCGACGRDCASLHQICSGLAAGCQGCAIGWADCDLLPSNGCETSTAPFNGDGGPNPHCGGCKKPCSTSCVNGMCSMPPLDAGADGPMVDGAL